MKTKHFLLASLLVGLVGITVQPFVGMCIKVLSGYLKNPHAPASLNSVLYGTQFALVKVVAVHPDSKPRGDWQETGTLDLVKIESNGKSLPAAFSIPYEKRTGVTISPGVIMIEDCQTWDHVTPKPDKRLVGFFRPEGKGWVIPEMAVNDLVLDVNQLSSASRKAIQPLFRARL